MNPPAVFADLALSRRLERAEGLACIEFAEAQAHLFPQRRAAWIECGGALAAFNGIDSPVAQAFALGVFEPLTVASLETLERFFLDRGAPVDYEISPFAGTAALDLLCSRGYRPLEISNVLFQPLQDRSLQPAGPIRVRAIDEQETQLWTRINAQGWTQEHPELREFVLEAGTLSSARRSVVCFLAEWEGEPAAAAALAIHEGVALLAGAATIPEMRRRGLQNALLEERLRHAYEHGCDLAMMVAEVGSSSQRNAERRGFRIAYTRTKWRLAAK